MKKIVLIVTVSERLYEAEFKNDAHKISEEMTEEILKEYPGEYLKIDLSVEDI